jgi:hypothetical protein
MLSKVEVRLEREEFDSLYRLARFELRSPAEQARYLLRKVLIAGGLLSVEIKAAEHHGEQRAEG